MLVRKQFGVCGKDCEVACSVNKACAEKSIVAHGKILDSWLGDARFQTGGSSGSELLNAFVVLVIMEWKQGTYITSGEFFPIRNMMSLALQDSSSSVLHLSDVWAACYARQMSEPILNCLCFKVCHLFIQEMMCLLGPSEESEVYLDVAAVHFLGWAGGKWRTLEKTSVSFPWAWTWHQELFL